MGSQVYVRNIAAAKEAILGGQFSIAKILGTLNTRRQKCTEPGKAYPTSQE
jgi:hypothetical protein